MRLKDLFKKNIPMRGNVRGVERDCGGSYWYLSDLFNARNITTLNMTSLTDKGRALSMCTPLSVVVDKLGSMIQRCSWYVTDSEGNEEKFKAYADALTMVNPLQPFYSFLRDVEICLRVYGFCPVSVVRGLSTKPAKSLWVLNPETFHLKGTGNMYRQFERSEVVASASYRWKGIDVPLGEEEYFVIYNGNAKYNMTNGELQFSSYTDSLSSPVNNWLATMSATHTLLANGGPKGVLYSDYQDAMGNAPMTDKEKQELHRQFNERYGIVGGKSPIFISPTKLGWLPMDYNADQLKIGEIDERCTADICNAFGLNPNLFSDAKYDNQESAKKAAYQDVIIPDSKVISEAISRHILPEGASLVLDFSDVECLQKNKRDEAQTLQTATSAIRSLLECGLISFEEARKEMANYIDIDPDELKEPKKEGKEDE